MAKYDPTVLHKFCDSLYAKANSVVSLTALLCGLSGSVAGFAGIVLAQGSTESGFIAAAICGALFGVAGVVIGEARAFAYRLEAQKLLCQLQIEINTRSHEGR